MSVTADTIVVGVDPRDMTEDAFTAVLVAAGSPIAAEARACYIALGMYPVSIRFALAVSHHDSSHSTAGINKKYLTKNPGNCRSSRTGAGTVITTEKGPFVQYPSYSEGFRDMVFRLVDPDYAYVKEGRQTIREIITRFAPASDNNSPESYIAAVVKDMNAWEDGPPMATPYDHIVSGMVDARSQLATAKQNQGGVKRGPYETIPITQKRGVVVHYRGVVTDAGAGLASFKADATYHVGKNWVSAGQPPVLGSGIMYHIGIDGAGTVYLLRDLDRVLWHCGAWPQNENTFAIQLPLGGNQQATAPQLASLKRVVDALLAFSGAPRSEVWGHQELSPTTCPGTLMDAFVRPYRAAGGTPPVDDGNPWFLHLGGGVMAEYAFRRGFRGVVEGLAIARYSADTNSAALSLTGEPIEEEWTGVDGNAYQRCKRVTLRYEPGNAAPWDVHFEAADMPLPERKPT